MSEIADIMSTDVITITEDSTILQAIALLVKHNITGLPVVDEEMKPVGIVSEKDMLKLVHSFQAREYDSSHQADTVKSVMSTDLITFDINDSLSDICKCLMDREFRRVPILDQGRIAGILSRRDLLKVLPTKHLQ